MPKVSVIMPAYNCEEYITAAIESVLNQTFQDFEFVIVDDCSNDATPDIIRSFSEKYPDKITFIRHKVNLGAAAARNTAIQNSRSNILMLADADDIQHINRMEVLYREFIENDVDMIFNDCRMIDRNGRSLSRNKGYPCELSNANVVLHLLKRNHLWIGLSMLRRQKDLVFDTSLPNAEDFELFLRLCLKGYKFKVVNQSLTSYRVHENNISSNGYISNQSVKTILSRLDLQKLYVELAQRHGEFEASVAVAAAYAWREEPGKVVELLEGKPFSLEGYFALAISYFKLGELLESLRVFCLLYEHTSNAAVLNNLSVIGFMIDSNYEQAKGLLIEALSIQPEYQDAVKNLEHLERGEINKLKLTERPLREQVVHSKHYKLV
ncbi:glycosyltransferase [Paenibacillus motobuensis]|uniref:Glycosyltransferase 2-like domain-containing protein n=1 Tax=Paenibacillus motobuensis TaxID=295324 RepID=A0ABN0XZK8_9BACL